MHAAIDKAKQEVYLEVYIFADDQTGRRIADALVRAAARGVKVCVVVDGFGSRYLAGTLLDMMAGQGVEILVFRPEVGQFRFHHRRLRRLHRKLAVIDGAVSFVGGINIIDDVNTPKQIPPRFDYAVRIEGPLLGDIYPVAMRMWRYLHWTHLRISESPSRLLPVVEPIGGVAAAFLIRDNVHHRRDIEEAYLKALATAQDEIIIANAYFLPGQRFRHALIDASARGVRVVLLLQGRVEYFLLHYATRALYGSLLIGGVHILEYQKSFLHAKVAVIDREWATVGSSNIDPFSLLLAREANVIIRDHAFAHTLRNSLRRAIMEGSVSVRSHWKERSLIDRMLSWMCYGITRLIMGLFGYAQD